jgi:hypothetical protein
VASILQSNVDSATPRDLWCSTKYHAARTGQHKRNPDRSSLRDAPSPNWSVLLPLNRTITASTSSNFLASFPSCPTNVTSARWIAYGCTLAPRARYSDRRRRKKKPRTEAPQMTRSWASEKLRSLCMCRRRATVIGDFG